MTKFGELGLAEKDQAGQKCLFPISMYLHPDVQLVTKTDMMINWSKKKLKSLPNTITGRVREQAILGGPAR